MKKILLGHFQACRNPILRILLLPLQSGKSVFAIFISFETKITGKKKRLIVPKNIIEMVKSQYHFSKTEFRALQSEAIALR